MTSNVNFDARPILQLFVIALCAVSQPINTKIIKKSPLCKFAFLKSYIENIIMKIIPFFC